MALEIIGDRPVSGSPMDLINKKSPQYDKALHDELLGKVKQRYNTSKQAMDTLLPRWDYADRRAKAFRYPDADDEKAVQAKKPRKFVISASQMLNLTAIYYLMNVFASRDPVFELTGDESNVEGSRIVERRLHRQFHRQQGITTFFNWFNSAKTYGLGWVKDYWGTVSQLKTTVNVTRKIGIKKIGIIPMPTVVEERTESEEPMVEYEGNLLSPIPVRNVFPDPRVNLKNYQDGEFIIEVLRRGKSYMKWKEKEGQYVNIDDAGAGASNADAPVEGHNPTQDKMMDSYDKGGYTLKECYIKLVPSECKLGDADYPQIWLITTANDTTVVRLEKYIQGRSIFPYFLIQDHPDASKWTNPGTSEFIYGVEQVIEWLINTNYRAISKSLNSNTLYRPDLLVDNGIDMNDSEYGFTARLLPGANPKEAYMREQIPYDTANFQNLAMSLFSFLERLTGVSENIQGVQSKVERTAHEVETVNQASQGRLSMTAMLYADQGTIPLSRFMTHNLQEFEPDEAIRAQIQGEYDFPVLEGTIFNKSDELGKLMQWTQMVAQLGVQPNGPEVAKQGAEILRIRNWRDLVMIGNGPPQIGVMPDSQIDNQVKSGNLVQIPG
jgi:hypothetical protein